MPYNLAITSFTDDLETTVNAPTGGAFQTAPVARYGARQRVITGNYEVATTEIDANDLIVLARLPATAIVQSIKIANDVLDDGASLVFDLGLYDENQVVIDANYFATASIILQSLTAAPGTDLLHEAATTAERVGARLWEITGGPATDPGGVMYDIVMEITTVAATAVAATLSYEILYTID